MKKSNRTEIFSNEQKSLMLDIMTYIDAFCRENKISYFLIGGSLIGAVRHKGYIPWDDDIDIALKRNDYEKFVRIFNQNASGKYKVLTNSINKDFYLPYAKVIDTRTVLKEQVFGAMEIGVNIDIFPLDYITEDTKENYHKIISRQSLYDIIFAHKSTVLSKERSLWKNIITVMLRIICPVPYSCIGKRRQKKMQKYSCKERTPWLANLYGAWGEKEICASHCFESTIEMEFEGHLFYAPVGYDEWLRNVYGDYMKLPPKEKQISHHAYDIWWK